MKKLYIIVISLLIFSSCEEVIDLELDNAPQQLVIDAALDWKKGDTKAQPIVDISRTQPYFSDTPSPAITDAVVKISTATRTYQLSLWDGTTTLTGANVVPLKGGSRYTFAGGIPVSLGEVYELTIELNGQTYKAKSKMLEAPTIPLNRVLQRNDGGLLGKQIELKFFFSGINDGIANTYLVRLDENDDVSKRYFGLLDDTYIANNQFFFITLGKKGDLKQNDRIRVRLHRVNPSYKEFAQFLLSPPTRQGNYSTPARAVGNIINTQNKKQNPLGGFRVSQYTDTEYIVR